MAPENDKAYLFVYGTLRHDHRHEVFPWLAKHGRLIGKARFQGRLFIVNHYPGAVESDAPDAWVRGEVYALPNHDDIWQRLDDYEECGPQCSQPTLYRRERKNVILDDGTAVDAWVYLYNRPTDALPEIQSGDFLSYLNTRRPRMNET
jgi:gamma-glutamylcyclotransferase (GGCT)/AIG2-like uncharacterized protein YtfP